MHYCKTTSIKMYILGVLCLLAFTTALPVIPEPPSLPGHGDVTVHDSVLRTNLIINEDGEHEEKKDENEAEPPEEVVILSLPEPPILPPIDEPIFVEIKPEEKEESNVDKDSEKEEDKIDDDKKPNKPWSIPRPPFITSIISSLGNINWPISIPNINWPFQIPSIFSRYPRIVYPDYIVEEVK